MVQIIPRQPTRTEGLLGSLNRGVAGFTSGAEEFKQALNARQTEKALEEQFGEQFRGVKNPEFQKEILKAELEKRNQQNKLMGEHDADKNNYKTIKDTFGQKFADVWKASPIGARTELLRAGVDANLRGIDIKRIFGEEASEKPTEQKEGTEFPHYKLPTEGLTPKDIVGFQKDLRSYNDPIFREAIKAKNAAKKASESFSELQKISGNIPEGLSRFFYDKEGNIRPLAQTLKAVPPEAELYVKIINDFTTQAKDSYGARVTNFELERFLKRLPTLANSKEGRDLILKRMKLTTEADRIVNQTIQDVYRHYGAGKITPEDAQAIAEQIYEPKIEALRSQGEQVDAEMERLSPSEEGGQSTQGKQSLKEIFG